MKIFKLLEKHADIFAQHDFDLEDTNMMEHKINTVVSELVVHTFRCIPNQVNIQYDPKKLQ